MDSMCIRHINFSIHTENKDKDKKIKIYCSQISDTYNMHEEIKKLHCNNMNKPIGIILIIRQVKTI